MPYNADYLQRGLERRVKQGLDSQKKAIERMMAQAAAAGALGSGRTLLLFEEISASEMRQWFSDAAQFVYSVTDRHDEDVARELEASAIELSDLMLHYVRQRARNTGLPEADVQQQIGKVGLALTNCYHELMDDFRHGISGSEKLKRDPLVNLVANQTNSPGAIQQIGSGTFSQSALVQNNGPLIQAIDAALGSPEFAALPQDKKDAVSDIAEALKTEAAKEKPNEGKIRRWGKRLVEMTADVGMKVASSTIAQVLVKIFGG